MIRLPNDVRMSMAGALAVILFAGQSLVAADLSIGAAAGYKGGLSMRAFGTAGGFAKGFPFGIEVGIGYSRQDPGNAADARRIFINDATNGTPEQSGYAWDARLDFLYDARLLDEGKTYLFGGIRYSMFNGNFVYVGGNENFDVTTDQWGLGVGIKGQFRMSTSLDFVISAGMDYYLNAGLSGHDTTYEPDGDNVNPRPGYSFKDADAAINQPKFLPVVMIGISYSL